eukprot:GABW01002029.1.p2 GENE.GABW01002029.1~~GABW01002029.1.p2  ORF type:complete len:130 (-),score=49.98 GABW01002029.1:47-436(-)
MRAKRTLSIGRIVLFTIGDFADKTCAVLDIIDQNRIVAVGPEVPRGVYYTKRIVLTDLVLKIGRGSSDKVTLAAWEKQSITATWEKTAWAQKLARRQVRAKLSDFDRFKIMCLRKKRSSLLRKEVAKKK